MHMLCKERLNQDRKAMEEICLFSLSKHHQCLHPPSEVFQRRSQTLPQICIPLAYDSLEEKMGGLMKSKMCMQH